MAKRSFYKQTTTVEATSTSTVLEVEKPTRFIHLPAPIIKLDKPARWGLWIILTGILTVLLGICSIAGMGYWYFHSFEQTAQTDIVPTIKNVWQKRQTNLFQSKKTVSILLLGIDQSKYQEQREYSVLTDTIALITLNDQGQLHMISIPRDLWIDSLKTKVNALYYYGQQSNPNDGVVLLNSVITEITGISVDYYAIVNMDTVKDVVDALGGITVDVQRTFEDDQYPREIDINSKDPTVLYETVKFNAGHQKFNGATALQFIRSRHSADILEGTDEGREMRQQQIIQSLLSETKNVSLISNPQIVGSLYRIWKQKIKTNLDDTTLALLALNLRQKTISVKQVTIPVKTNDTDGLIYHPNVGPAKQWVYLPIDPNWDALKLWVAQQLQTK